MPLMMKSVFLLDSKCSFIVLRLVWAIIRITTQSALTIPNILRAKRAISCLNSFSVSGYFLNAQKMDRICWIWTFIPPIYLKASVSLFDKSQLFRDSLRVSWKDFGRSHHQSTWDALSHFSCASASSDSFKPPNHHAKLKRSRPCETQSLFSVIRSIFNPWNQQFRYGFSYI